MPFFDTSAKYGFAWGDHDCMLEIADWLDYSCGFKVAVEWRGLYTSEAECDALMASLGGFEQAMRDEAERVGLDETVTPAPGDVALVTVPGMPKMVGAIITGSGKWRIRIDDGFVASSAATVIVAWRVPWQGS